MLLGRDRDFADGDRRYCGDSLIMMIVDADSTESRIATAARAYAKREACQ